MKKVCVIIGLMVFFLCGCAEQKTEETWFMDFDAKDKEFGQFQGNRRDDTEVYEDELDKFYINIEEYVDFIMEDDARGMVNSFSTKLIAFLGDVNGVSYDTAKEIAREKVAETFEKTDIKDLYDGWSKKQHRIEISKVRAFSQRAELIDAYLGCGIRITDAVEVEFKVIAGPDERKARLRLIKNQNGGWATDADYFF
ncbi:MAG: hypothetical protein IKC07_01265 [Clostridia bacterium]|nr:hypothetical protein [Clostridia bacterium]